MDVDDKYIYVLVPDVVHGPWYEIRLKDSWRSVYISKTIDLFSSDGRISNRVHLCKASADSTPFVVPITTQFFEKHKLKEVWYLVLQEDVYTKPVVVDRPFKSKEEAIRFPNVSSNVIIRYAFRVLEPDCE